MGHVANFVLTVRETTPRGMVARTVKIKSVNILKGRPQDNFQKIRRSLRTSSSLGRSFIRSVKSLTVRTTIPQGWFLVQSLTSVPVRTTVLQLEDGRSFGH